MNDKTNFPFWNTDWLEAQRKYMETWAALSQDAMHKAGAAEPGGNGGTAWDATPMNKALEYWWKSVSQTADDDTRAFYDKLLDQTQAFYFVTDQLTRFLQGFADVAKNSDEWQQELDKHFDEMKALILNAQGKTGHAMNSMLGAWQLPMDTMQRTLSSVSLFPGDFLQGFEPDLQAFRPDDIRQATDHFLSVPGIGYTRESQEQVQNGLRLWIRYQSTLNEYQAELGKVVVRALDHMKACIMDRAEKQETISSLREIYDLWVDCNESAYAEYVSSDEYSEIYGRLVNDLIAVKQHGRHYMDSVMSSLSMPSRKEINTMQKRQQQNRRELMDFKAKVEKLEDELQALRSQTGSQVNVKPATPSSTVSKKTTSKKKAKKKAAVKKA
jgi:polyhydroxyalkanoate synthase subunit PhaE